VLVVHIHAIVHFVRLSQLIGLSLMTDRFPMTTGFALCHSFRNIGMGHSFGTSLRDSRTISFCSLSCVFHPVQGAHSDLMVHALAVVT